MKEADSKAYEQASGTSLSAPHVSGAAAVVLSNNPQLSSEQLTKSLLDGATPLLISADNVAYELSGLMTKDIVDAFIANPNAESIVIKNQKVLHDDWLRGQASYGQGRVNLDNSLYLASLFYSMDIEDMT